MTERNRTVRGGCWDCNPVFCRSAYSGDFKPETRSSCFGFRIVIRENGPIPEKPVVQNKPMASNRLPVRGTKAGERAVVMFNGVEFAFRWCPAGTFMMGTPDPERDNPYIENKEKQHLVTLTKGFWIMETEVTQKQWKAIMVDNPSWFKVKGDDLPFDKASRFDVQTFCEECARIGMPLRLPTEAQWEYACRAGTTTAYFWGDDFKEDKANGNRTDYREGMKNGRPVKTEPVASYDPNPWGLYDMHGNIDEWCNDVSGDYPNGHVVDPTGADEGFRGVIRGGKFNSKATFCRSAARSGGLVGDDYIHGFRCVYGEN